MIKKMKISKEKRERIIDKAGHLADETGMELMACAPATFVAICDAFRSEDIELFEPQTQDIITQAMMGLHGGIAMTGVGTCGAITASVFVISYVVGVPLEELKKNGNLNFAPSLPAVEYVIDRFEEDYGAMDCLRIRYNRVQRALDLTDPDARILEMTFSMLQPEKCGMTASKYENGRDQTPPVRGARYACEAICDLLEMTPEQRRELPPHIKGLGPEEMHEKLEKVVNVLKEMGWGRPDEKISYREYRKFKIEGKEALERDRLGSTKAPKKEEYDN